MAKAAHSSKCGVCNHQERARIELLRARGVGYEAVASQFGLKKDAIYRHWRDHVTDEAKARMIGGPARMQELADRANAENMSALDYFAIVRTRLMDQFIAATDAGDRFGAATVSGRLLEALREIGKLTGEIQKISGATTINQQNILVMQSPIVAELQAMLVSTLAPWPEARAAVIAGMRKIEGRTAPAAAPMIEGARADAVAAE